MKIMSANVGSKIDNDARSTTDILENVAALNTQDVQSICAEFVEDIVVKRLLVSRGGVELVWPPIPNAKKYRIALGQNEFEHLDDAVRTFTHELIHIYLCERLGLTGTHTSFETGIKNVVKRMPQDVVACVKAEFVRLLPNGGTLLLYRR